MSADSHAIRNTTLIEPASLHVVDAKDICHFYGEGETRTQVLFDNCLEIGVAEVVLLTGPSGSGKTTLLTLVGALRRIQTGSLRVLEQDLAGASAKTCMQLRRQIGFIFQHHNLFGSLTALENVRMAAALGDESAAVLNRRCKDILARLGLAERMNHPPARLSGGQRQRVAIARALVNRPRLVLADEPTAALDADSGATVMQLFRELADGADRTTVLIVSHDHRLLNKADRIINMVSGRIVSNIRPVESIRICKALRESLTMAPQHVSESVLAQLSERMFVQTRKMGETIVKEGLPGDAYYLVGRGIAEAYVSGAISRRIEPNQGFGEITSISGRNQAETVLAKTDVELFVLPQPDLKTVIEHDEQFDEQLRLYYMNKQ